MEENYEEGVTLPSLTPHRISLAAQAFEALQAAILRGDWKETLPPEAILAERMQIGRSTLRIALERLRKEGVIDAGRGRRSRILLRESANQKRELKRSVAIASGVLLSQMPSSSLYMIERIERSLHQAGYVVEHHFESYFSARDPKKGINEILARESRVGCWLFLSPSQKIQEFLHRQAIDAVIAGSSFEGIVA